MQTTTTVSLGTFSTASRYPTASTVSTDPYTLLLGLFFRLAPFCSSRRRDSRHRRIKSSSPSSLKELAGEVFSCCGRDNSVPHFVLSKPAALSRGPADGTLSCSFEGLCIGDDPLRPRVRLEDGGWDGICCSFSHAAGLVDVAVRVVVLLAIVVCV